MKDQGIQHTGVYGLDVPDGLCYQWSEDYFNEDDPDSVITPRGQFTSGPQRRALIAAEKLEEHLQKCWEQESETLIVPQIHQMTGYSERLIGKWIRAGKLSAMGRAPYCVVTKTALIRFFVAAPDDPKFFYADKYVLILEKR